MRRIRPWQAALWMVAAVWLANGCAGHLSTYETQDPEEAMIRDLLVKWQTTCNNGDAPGNLSVRHANARIMHGMERRLATKKEYVDILPERMKANPKVKPGAPEIRYSARDAEVKTTLATDRGQLPVVFYLVKENGAWTIMSWKY